MSLKFVNSKKGISLTEILVAFTIFIISIFSVVFLYYNVLRINTNSSLAEMAMQNLDIICSYLRNSPGIRFEDTLQNSTNDYFVLLDNNLIQATPGNNNDNFVNLNNPPLDNASFVKPDLFKRHIRCETLWSKENRVGFNLGYHRVAVFTVTIRWRDKNMFRTVSKSFSISRDEVRQ